MNQPAEKLSSFALSIMEDVLREHLKVVDHGSGYCCQVAEKYTIRIGTQKSLAGKNSAPAKSVDNPLTEPQRRMVLSLYRRCPDEYLSPAMREQVTMVSQGQDIPFEVASALIDALKAVSQDVPKSAALPERPITPAMAKYLRVLLDTRVHDEKVNQDDLDKMPFRTGHKMISRLKSAPYANANGSAPSSEPEEGLYKVGEVVYKVQKAKANGTGKAYAKVMSPEDGSFSYVGRKPFPSLTEETKMGREEAGRYGKLYGICIRCGRDLTDEFSIETGLGKICYEKMGG